MGRPIPTCGPVSYERALTDVLKLQGEMARAIADEVRIQVTPEDRARMSAARDCQPNRS